MKNTVKLSESQLRKIVAESVKKVLKESDINNRDFAILIVNGEVFTGESHSLALNKFLKNNSEFFRKSNERFENNEIPDDVNSLAFAHAVKENNK